MFTFSPVTPVECTAVPLGIVSPLTFLAVTNISVVLSAWSALRACDEDIALFAQLAVRNASESDDILPVTSNAPLIIAEPV